MYVIAKIDRNIIIKSKSKKITETEKKIMKKMQCKCKTHVKIQALKFSLCR